MKIAHYTGDHSADGLAARIGWAITRHTQSGPYGNVTHCEAIHAEYTNGEVLIASSSLRDGGVRSKRVRLNPAHWMIVDCPAWHMLDSQTLLLRTEGKRYDLRGALATRLPGRQDTNRWFCNEWVGSPYVPASATFGPHQFCAVTLTIGKDVTREFFESRA